MFSFLSIKERIKSSLEKLTTDDSSENEIEKDTKNFGKKNINAIVRLILIGVLVIVSFLAVIKISSFAFGGHKGRKTKEAKAVYKVISAEITDVKEILKGSFLRVPFSDYDVKHYTRDDDKESQMFWQKVGGALHKGKEEDIVVYIDRGVCKLGIDLEKVTMNVDEKQKKIFFHCPPVEILSFERNTETSKRYPIEDSKTVNASNMDNAAKVHADIEYSNRQQILSDYSAKCQESIRKCLNDYVLLLIDGYTAEVDFEK